MATALAATSLLLLGACASADANETAAAVIEDVESHVEQAEVGADRQSLGISPIDIPIARDVDSVLALAPTLVVFPSLGIDMEVTDVGVDSDNLLIIPESIYTAGWYREGSAPASDRGATVISAHVDMPIQGVGPFAALRDAEIGAEVTVRDAAGESHVYRVISVERIPKAEVPVDRVFTRAGQPHLVLINCGGSFDVNAQSYSDNYIVTAEKVS